MKRETVEFNDSELERHRHGRLYSIKDLAKDCGLSPTTVQRAVSGLPVSLRTARLICERLGVTRDEVCKP